MDQQQEAVSGMDLKLKDVLKSFNGWHKYLLKRWWIMLLAGIIGGLAGIYYASRDLASYESRLTFSLEGESKGLGGAFSLAAEFGLNLGGSNGTFSGDNILEILICRRMIERTLVSADTVNGKITTLAEQYKIASDMDEGLKNNPRLKGINFPVNQPRESFTYLQDSVLFLMYAAIAKTGIKSGKPDKKLNIYEVTFTSNNETFSKRFIEKLISETTTFYSEIKTKRSKETLIILQHRVDSLRGSLNSSISSRAAAQDANLNPAFAAPLVQAQKRQVDVSVYGAAYGELYKSLEMARYQYQKEIPLLQIIDEPNYPLRRIKLGKLKTGIIGGIALGLLTTFFLISIYSIKSEKPATQS